MTAGYPSEEPIAGKPHDGICGGESQQWPSYPTFVRNRTLSQKVNKISGFRNCRFGRYPTFGVRQYHFPPTTRYCCSVGARWRQANAVNVHFGTNRVVTP